MSDEEFDEYGVHEDEDVFYDEDEDDFRGEDDENDTDEEEENGRASSIRRATKRQKVGLPRDSRNVGKSLRPLGVGDDEGDVVSKLSAFESKGQLSMGKAERANLDDLDIGGDSEDEDDADETEEDDEEGEPEAPFTLMQRSSRMNGDHVRRQRKAEADVLGVRIRLQGLLNQLVKLQESTKKKPDTAPVKSIVESLLNIRLKLFENGPVEYSDVSKLEVPSCDNMNETWNYISALDESLWEKHETIIRAWERRAHLQLSRGKELRAMNKSAFEQLEAALARRAEIGKQSGDFIQEDQSFYQTLLKDFVQARAADQSAKRPTSKRQAYLQKQKNRAPIVRYEVREKMVNFVTPVALPAPPIDVDQLVKSLFRT